MRVFKVRASSSSPRPPLCQISFPSRPPWLSQPIEKNMHYWRSQRGEGEMPRVIVTWIIKAQYSKT